MELATKFNGEIINGDAMQMYKGLPIITNKIPEAERNGIPHHLLDFIALHEKPWSVYQFVRESHRVIDEIRARGKLPILVGGTHYYSHALLFKDAILGNDTAPIDKADHSDDESDQQWPILSQPTNEIHSKLEEVDPESAKRWHPKDRRKIQTALRIWLRTGRKASDIYAEQQARRADNAQLATETDPNEETSESAVGLRFPTLLLWLEAEDAVLKERLNKRVDSMLEDGLMAEARLMAQVEVSLKEKGEPVDRTKGIWISIGYKEVEPYLQAETGALDNPTPNKAQILQEAVEAVKAGTRQYAKRQNRYIRVRLADAVADAGQLRQLFLLDSTKLDQWNSMVSQPAEKLASSFLEGDNLPNPVSLSPLAEMMLGRVGNGNNNAQRLARTCEVCNKVLMTDNEWNIHLSSRNHKNTVAAQKRRTRQFEQILESSGAQGPGVSDTGGL